jgi:hypothetical protein
VKDAGARPSILAVMEDPGLFGRWFAGSSWDTWKATLAACFGLPMTVGQLEIFRTVTGRITAPTAAAREFWAVVGRRGGKSLIVALIAVYISTFIDYTSLLAPGERAVLLIVAADRAQAKVVFNYVRGLLRHVPLLERLVESETSEAIRLQNQVEIQIATASFRTIRGRTLIGAIADEVAFWRSEDSLNPDTEILGALRPGLASIPGAMLFAISTPYSRKGEVWQHHKAHFGRDGDPILVVQGATRTFNPMIPQAFVDAELARDEAWAKAEYLGEFRSDLEAFVTEEVLEPCINRDRPLVRPPIPGVTYTGFLDHSGGRVASAAVAVTHADGGRIILDGVWEWRAPFDPDVVTEALVTELRRYHITRVISDRYAGDWVASRLRAHEGMRLAFSSLSKSELYANAIPLFTAGAKRVELPDAPRLVKQLLSLERRTGRTTGQELIGPPEGTLDDVANAACGALVSCGRGRPAFTGYAESLAREEAAWAVTHPAPVPGEWTVRDLQLGFGALAPKPTLVCSSCGRPDDQASGWLLCWGGATCPACAQGRRPDEA